MVADRNGTLSASFDCLGDDGNSQRCVVIIDQDGAIRHYSVTDGAVGRSVKEIVRIIAAIRATDANADRVAGCEWQPGDDLIDTTAE